MSAPLLVVGEVVVLHLGRHDTFERERWRLALERFSMSARSDSPACLFVRGCGDSDGSLTFGLHLEEEGQYYEAHSPRPDIDFQAPATKCVRVGCSKLAIADAIDRLLSGEYSMIRLGGDENNGLFLAVTNGDLRVGKKGHLPGLGDLFWR